MINYLIRLGKRRLQRMESIPGISQELSKAGLGSVAALQHARAGLAELSTADLMKNACGLRSLSGMERGTAHD
jgi:hypothetical protein